MTETLDVDITNPGQVFACLGVLEVLDLLSPGALGRFTEDDAFEISVASSVLDAVESLKNASMEEELHDARGASWGGDKTWPVVIRGGFGTLALDPWLTPSHDNTASGCKLWAGRVGTLDLLKGLQGKLTLPEHGDSRNLFSLGQPSTPSGLDPRSAVSKEDLGYSYDSHSLKPIVYPAVDLFAMIGLQGARPERTGGLTYAYSLWGKHLPPLVSRAVVTGILPQLATSRWEYRVESRGLGGTYKYLSSATPTKR